MPLTDEQKEQFATLLAEAEPDDVAGYLPATSAVPTATLKGRLGSQKKGYESALADHQAQLAERDRLLSEAQAELDALRKKDMSTEEIRNQALIDAEKRFDAQKALTEQATARANDLYEAKKAAFIRDSVSGMIAASGVSAARLPTALREAMAENEFSVKDDDGVFSLQMTKDGLPVEDPKAEFTTGWYLTRNDLHAKTGTEMPSPGAGRPPGDPPPKDPTEGLTPEQILAKGLQQFG